MASFLPLAAAAALCFSLGAALPSTRDATGGQLRPRDLRCEYLVDPLGLGETSPRLSWTGDSSRRGEHQSAYQILVASTPEALARDKADLWDSARVASDESAHVVYGGRPLGSRAACFWKVRLWDRDGQPSAWSEPARWTLGLLEPADWQAKWIDGHDPQAPGPGPAVTLRRAIYGTPEGTGSADVTAAVKTLLESGRADLTVDNTTLGGDPVPGQMKRLHLEYEQGGVPGVLNLNEGDPLRFGGGGEPPRVLRKTFSVDGDVARATLYVTALGLYECRINGEPVSDHFLAPDWTDYDKRVRYQAYDVSALVRPGGNALAALVADGWYSGHIGNHGFQRYGVVPALLAQLEIVHADGRVERIITDDTWKSHASAILAADLLMGESYDARREIAGWYGPGFDDKDWTPAHVRDEKPRALDAQVAPPVRVLGERRAVALTQPAPGRWVFDLGQNMVGVAHLKVTAPVGKTLTLHHAEMLTAAAAIYTANLRGAACTDTYVCKGGGVEEWQPRFTFHGFRYVELSGLPPGQPELDAVTGVVIGSDVPAAGTFAFSDGRLHQRMSNVAWGLRGNYVSVPTDCPQRDERLGWMGDAQVFLRTATDVADVAAFFTKWLVDVDDAQTPEGAYAEVAPDDASGVGAAAWADAGVICPWTIYQAYGDRRVLERHLPAMTRWVEWLCEKNPTRLRENTGYGDWLSVGADTPKDLIGTAYFAYSAHLLAKSCQAVGRSVEAEKYQRVFEEVRAAFDRAYVAPDGRIKGDTQCGYAVALKFELLPEDIRPRAVQYLAEDVSAHGNHLTTGFVGVGYLLPALAEGGRLDTAYALLTQDTFPSWLFPVKQGATTIWERWDGWTPEKGFQTPSMNSFNHYSLGTCGEWLYDTVAGIGWDEDAPGYQKMVMHPRPGGGLTFARATRQTMYGKVVSAWKVDGGRFILDVTVPANTTARVVLPTADAADVTEGGQPLATVKEVATTAPTNGGVTLAVGSGSYQFACSIK